jgi:uncharacterized protein (TIGR00369 family)
MPPPGSSPDPDRRVRDSLARQGLLTGLGARLVDVAAGSCVLELPYGPRVTQQQGLFHGAAVGAVADSAGGYAALTLAPAGYEVLTVEYKINFFAPAQGERLVARGRVLRAGRTSTCAIEVAVVRDGVESACAAALQTVVSVPERPG